MTAFLMGCVLALASLGWVGAGPLNGAPPRTGEAHSGGSLPLPTSRGAVPDAASEETRETGPAEFDLATGGGQLGGAPLSGSSSLRSGLATWYDDGPGLYAAAGPELRHGDWRGSRVKVCGDLGCVVVTLYDACWCPDRGGVPVLLDLSATAFRRLAPLSVGVIQVEVTTAIPLPATDTEE